MFKKSISIKVMAILLVVFCILSLMGCTKKEPEVTVPETNVPDVTTPEPEKPVEEEPSTLVSPTRLKIKAWSSERIDAPMNNDLPVFKELIEKTNIEFDWELAPTASEKEKFNLMMSTGDLPDIIFYSDSNFLPYAEADLFEPLKDLIEEHAPNLKKHLIDNPDVRREVTFDNGEIYYVTRTTDAVVNGGFMIREDWLQKLDLKMPVTLDDWYETMVAFKNGNINSNEVIWPFTGRASSDLAVSPMKHFMGAWGIDLEWFVDNDELKCGAYEPVAKDAFEWIRKLYTENLIDPDIFTNNASAWEARITNEISGWTRDSRGRADTFTVMLKDVNPDAQFIGIAPPKGPAGVMSFDKSSATAGRSAAIKKGSEYKVELIKFLDFCYSEEGLKLNNFGLEGIHYTELTGDKVVFTDLIMNNPDGLAPGVALMNQGIDRTIPFHYDNRLEMGFRSRGSVSIIEAQLPILRTPYPKGSMKYTDAERDIYNEKWLDIYTYMDERLTEFVMGLEPMEKWDAFRETLKEMGIEDVIKIQNDVYQRYLAK